MVDRSGAPSFYQPSGSLGNIPTRESEQLKNGVKNIIDTMEQHGREASREMQQVVNGATSSDNIETFKRNAEARKQQLINKYDEQTENGVEAMKRMTPTQQKQYMSFWDELGKFLEKSLDWINEKLKKFINLVIQGIKLGVEVIKDIFNAVGSGLTKAWNWLKG